MMSWALPVIRGSNSLEQSEGIHLPQAPVSGQANWPLEMSVRDQAAILGLSKVAGM